MGVLALTTSLAGSLTLATLHRVLDVRHRHGWNRTSRLAGNACTAWREQFHGWLQKILANTLVLRTSTQQSAKLRKAFVALHYVLRRLFLLLFVVILEIDKRIDDGPRTFDGGG